MPENKNVREYMNRLYGVKDQCLKNKTSYFVEHSEETTKITNTRLNAEQVIAMVMNDKDGPDQSFVFGLKSTDIQVGDYLTLEDNTHYLVYESVRVIKDVDYNKFKALECNVTVNSNIYAYFVSSKTSPKDISMSREFETSKLLPVLICPIAAGLKIDDQIKINNQVWDIIEVDDLTNPLIGYYTIERGTNTMSSQITSKKDKANVLYAGTQFTVATEDGFYESEINLKVVQRTATSVTFEVPNAAEFSVRTLKNGVNVDTTYSVRESR